jgi:hypothetical protein
MTWLREQVKLDGIPDTDSEWSDNESCAGANPCLLCSMGPWATKHFVRNPRRRHCFVPIANSFDRRGGNYQGWPHLAASSVLPIAWIIDCGGAANLVAMRTSVTSGPCHRLAWE